MKFIIGNNNLKSQWITIRIKEWNILANQDNIVTLSRLEIV